METWQVLEKAAALIEERGWTRGLLEAESGEVCVLGAIGLALDVPREPDGELSYFNISRSPAVRALADALGSPCRWPEMPVWTFNDSATDASEVVDTLRAVAQTEWSAA